MTPAYNIEIRQCKPKAVFMEIQTSIGNTHITVCCCRGQDAE